MTQGRCAATMFFLALLAAAVLLAPPAWAGGVEILEQGRGVGASNAGVRATADDPATVWWNPAGMTRFRSHAAALNVNAIIPNADFVDEGSFQATVGGPIPLMGAMGNTDSAVPTGGIFGVWSLSQCWKIGLGVNTPFGLETDWGRDWMGRYFATKSALLTVNINPSVAYRINRNWSVAAGVNFMYAHADLGTAIDFGSALGAPQMVDGHLRMTGDSWGIGFNLGVLWEPTPCTRVGLHYRSRVKQKLDGTADYDVPAAAQPLVGLTGRFIDTPASTEVTLPDTAGLSVVHELSPRWALLGDVTWTGWSTFDELVVDFENAAEPNQVTPWDWDDTWRVALGASFKPSSCWTLRAGVAWDQSPIPDSTRSPRIPGNDRIWASFGVGWRFHRNWELDAFYAHIFVDDGPMGLSGSTGANLLGHVESSVEVVGLQLTWRM